MKKCAICEELQVVAGVVPLPLGDTLEVCGKCLELFKQEFRERAERGEGVYYDLYVQRP